MNKNTNETPSVEVLMSTYNGSNYVAEQIFSILNQTDVKIHITIRDDGSKDNTVIILNKLKLDYPSKIDIIEGKNLGYEGSFLTLLLLRKKDCDFYAFSDQDDVWLPNKCKKAIEFLHIYTEKTVLYVSAIDICDEFLKRMYTNRFDLHKNSLKSIFARYRYPGCVMLFTATLADSVATILQENTKYPFSHDFFVSAVAYLSGRVVIDSNSYILHRRVRNSLTARKGVFNRLKTEFNVVFMRRYESSKLAQFLLESNMEFYENDKKFLKLVVAAKTNFIPKLRLIGDKEFSCGIKGCDLETYFKILIGNF